MSAFYVTVQQEGRPPVKFFAIGSSSGAVGESIAARFCASEPAAISVHPLNRSRK